MKTYPSIRCRPHYQHTHYYYYYYYYNDTVEQEGQHPLTGEHAAMCFQWGSVSLRSDIKGMELLPANILIPLERQLIALQLCH